MIPPNDPTIQGPNSKTQFLFQEFQATLPSSNPSEAASVCRLPKSTTKFDRQKDRSIKSAGFTRVFSGTLGNPGCFTRVTRQLLNGLVQKWGTQKSQRLIIFLIKNDRFGVYTRIPPNVGQIGRHIQVCLT